MLKRAAGAFAPWLLLVVVSQMLVAACARPAIRLGVVSVADRAWCDTPIEVRFDAPLDPASVTARSVVLSVPGRGALDVRRDVSGPVLRLSPVVDQAWLDDPPNSLELELHGAPSLHALRSRTGALLADSTRHRLGMQAGWGATFDGAPRLLRAGGRMLDGEPVVARGGRITLEFVRWLDPATVRPEACPLVPLREGLRWNPVVPELCWRAMGERFEVDVELPVGVDEAELATRQLGFQGLWGSDVEPMAVLQLVRGD